jgi:type VI protein secretion system component Hcp
VAKASLYLKIIDKKGHEISGECIDARHLDEIDISGWDWSVEDPAALPKKIITTAGDIQKNKPKTEDEGDAKIKPSLLRFSKRTDKSTVPLIRAMDNGEILTSATLVLEEEFEDDSLHLPFYLAVILKEVIVTKLSWSVDAGNSGLDWKESWELNYRHIRFSYQVRKKPRGTIDIDFDRPKNADGVASKKSPLTDREKREAEEMRRAEDAKYQAKKTGK